MTTNRLISLESTDKTLQREEKIVEFYYVLWIGWEDGVAHRRLLIRLCFLRYYKKIPEPVKQLTVVHITKSYPSALLQEKTLLSIDCT